MTNDTDSMDMALFEKRMLGAQQRYVLPVDAREIILVRHGSAIKENIAELPFGDLTLANPPLSPHGIAQAKAVATRLARESIAQIFVTPLQRTQQTAAPLEALTGLKAAVVPELREAYMGDWELNFYDQAANNDSLMRKMLVEETWEVIPNAERMAEFSARVRAGIERIAGSIAVGSIAVAYAHGGTISELCRQATSSRPFGFFGPENTSITRLVVQADGRWSLRCYNDVAHL
jgi:2,3-bisphosphoglycerate-dependent phosphoglycerate mutase